MTLVSLSTFSLEGVELRKMRNSVSICWMKSALGWESYKLASLFGAYGLKRYKRLVENRAHSFYVSKWPSHNCSWNPNIQLVG